MSRFSAFFGKALRSSGAKAVAAVVVGLLLLVAPVAASADSAPALVSQQGDTIASASYGFAGASWDWTGPGSVSNIDLVVADWACDAHPVYAYFRVNRTNNQFWNTSTRRYDYSGCDLPDFSEYTGLRITDGFNIASLQLYICVDGGACTLGGASGRNPYA